MGQVHLVLLGIQIYSRWEGGPEQPHVQVQLPEARREDKRLSVLQGTKCHRSSRFARN